MKVRRRFGETWKDRVQHLEWAVRPAAFPGGKRGDTRWRERGAEVTDTAQRCHSRLRKQKSRAWMVDKIRALRTNTGNKIPRVLTTCGPVAIASVKVSPMPVKFDSKTIAVR